MGGWVSPSISNCLIDYKTAFPLIHHQPTLPNHLQRSKRASIPSPTVMASLVLLLSELLRPNSSSLAFLSSQPPPPSSTPFPSSSPYLSRWSFSTKRARRFEVGNDKDVAEAVVLEDLQEPKVCVDLVWP